MEGQMTLKGDSSDYVRRKRNPKSFLNLGAMGERPDVGTQSNPVVSFASSQWSIAASSSSSLVSG